MVGQVRRGPIMIVIPRLDPAIQILTLDALVKPGHDAKVF
jgi:hypothetical protein